jgi:TonB-linked SusC/RagA family outer membrane protein
MKKKRLLFVLMKRGIRHISWLIILLLLLSSTNTFAQSRLVKGLVQDEKGITMPGVNVTLKGTSTGVVTDVNGKYSISISGNEMLIFSFLGYESQEIAVQKRTVINVVLLPTSKELGEVVVVGYGTQSKHNITGSITQVDVAKIANLPNTNVSQELRGIVAGVQVTENGRPGQSGTILIRGPRSLSASNDPLIVLDGIIFSGSLTDINPNDIQSLAVLKDASSAAIYGSRAANGVILVTSKIGTTEKPRIRFNFFTGVSEWAYKVKLFSPERYVQSKLDYRAQSGLEADPSKIASYLLKTESDNYIAGISHNPWDEASQPGRIGSYDLSISGRSQSTNYYISGSLVDEKGLIFDDNQKRISVRANIDNQITDWMSIGINSTFIHRDLSGVSADLGNAYTNSPYGNWYYSDGAPTQFIVPEDQAYGNSVRTSILTTNEEIYDNLFSNIYAKITVPFIKGLNYRINYSPNYRWNHNYNFFRQDKHLTNNTTNASKFDQKNFDWVLENILTYSKRLGKNHALDFTLLYGRNHYGFESTTATADQLSSDALGFNNLGLGSILSNSSTASATEGISSMIRINYRFKEKYLLTLTGRQDGSSVFAENNKYATFPSGSLAWIVSDEPFIKKAAFIDMLKLRLSYGAVGNQAIGPYQSLGLSSTNQYVYGDGGATSLGVYPSNMGNTSLKWETTYTANAAIDFDLFKGRLGGTIEVYNSNTSDLLVRRSIPVMTGFNSVFTNIGKINNKGIELTLNSINIQEGKFEWGTNFVFSANRNKIVHLYNTDANGDGKEDDDIANNWFIGHPITTYYDYVFDGIYQVGDQIPSGSKPGFVRFKDLNGDGKIDANDRAIIGSGGQPDLKFGITNILRYGNVSLSVFVNAMQGWISSFPLLNTAVSPNAPGRGLNQLDAGYWTAENKSTTRPSLVYNNPLSAGWYLSRNFVRIQDVSLSYQFSKKMLSKLKISNLTVFMSGKNLYTFTKWLGSDPESGGTSGSSFYPIPRTITFGVNIGF